MTTRYLMRVGMVAVVLAATLAIIFFVRPVRPKKAGDDKWRFYFVGQASTTDQAISSKLLFASGNGSTPVLDHLALLSGGLAYLPKKAFPLFGRKEPKFSAVADAVLEPGKCLLVKSVQFDRALVSDGSGGGPLLGIDESSRLSTPSAKLRALLPRQCTTSIGAECQIVVWVEARPKKCD